MLGETQGEEMKAIQDSATVSLRGAPQALTDMYDVGLLDLDGVIYLDGQPIPSASAALAEARAQGMRFAFVTNNASRTPARIAAQLDELGVPASPSDVVTSAQAAARLVADQVPAGSRVLVVGAVGLRQAVRNHGLRPVTTAYEEPAAVVQGYDPQMRYDLLAEGALAIRHGAFFVASNADATMPTPRGPLPGNGAMLRVLATATGQEPLIAGKPELPLHREAVLRTDAKRPLVVGDRLDTDIEGAVRAGTPGLLVLTGVTNPADVVVAPPQLRPTHLARNLGGLLEPHPEPTRNGEIWSCGGWTAREGSGGLSLSGDPSVAKDPIDGLRALCAAAWAANEPLDPGGVAAVVRQLDLC